MNKWRQLIYVSFSIRKFLSIYTELGSKTSTVWKLIAILQKFTERWIVQGLR